MSSPLPQIDHDQAQVDMATFVNALGDERNAWKAQAQHLRRTLARIAKHGGVTGPAEDGSIIVGHGQWCAQQAKEALEQ